METFEVYPNKGIGPFRLGMTEDKVVELQNRLFPGVFPGYYCRTDYLDGRLAGVGLLADENRQILWDGLELTHVHVEELIPEASEGEHSNLGTIAFAIGFALMMMLDVALG